MIKKISLIDKKSAFPFAKDTSSFFMPWMIMFMVFLATLTFSGGMAINSMTSNWNKTLSGSLTVQVLPQPKNQQKKEKNSEEVSQVETALIILRDTKGVTSARALTDEEMKLLLEPWLGENEIIADMPLPQLIDVTLDDKNPPNLETLAEELKKHAPLASLDTHRMWLEKLSTLINGLKTLVSTVIMLIVGATTATVIYATRTSLVVHKPVIELLHLIGAHDFYIALQYAKRALVLGLVGAIIGFLLAFPAITWLGNLASSLGGGPLAAAKLNADNLLLLSTTPILAAIISMITAFFTVRRVLARML